mmetsp:Transcript_49757/g.130874  ORF Transcript_49757/g.130874 Transcript_49757/m.130874 type:complete len:88 (-) Transcript_49757:132-395(-)
MMTVISLISVTGIQSGYLRKALALIDVREKRLLGGEDVVALRQRKKVVSHQRLEILLGRCTVGQHFQLMTGCFMTHGYFRQLQFLQI